MKKNFFLIFTMWFIDSVNAFGHKRLHLFQELISGKFLLVRVRFKNICMDNSLGELKLEPKLLLHN